MADVAQAAPPRPAPPRKRPPTYPWTDRRGRLSRLKAICFALMFVPALAIGIQYVSGAFPGRPITEVLHGFGFWTVRFLLIALAITPAIRLLDWPDLALVRRMVGVTAMAYVLGHLALYVVDENFHLLTVASEIVRRVYLSIGFVALVGLVALGVTSTDAALRRMGVRWKELHRTIYLLTAIGILHFFMQAKANVSEAVVMAGFLLWLLLWRLLPGRWSRNLLVLLVMAPVVAVATAYIEAGWYAVATHINPMRVLQANLMFRSLASLRPSAWVFLTALGVVAVSALARLVPGRKRMPARA